MAGNYTDIIEIGAPDDAVSGDTVNVYARVKNLWPYTLDMWVAGVVDSETRFIDQVAHVGAGDTYTFRGAFLMPGSKVTVNIYVYYGTAQGYILDDSGSKDVDLAELVSEFSQFEITDYSKV